MISRVCKSAKTAKTIALENAVDMAIAIGIQVKKLQTGKVMEEPVPIRGYTDSASLIESIRSTKPVDEGPMRLNVERLKDHIKMKFVTEYKWVPTNMQLADPLTKTKVDPTLLRRVLKTGFWKKPE